MSGDRDAGDLAILINTRGGMRMLDPSGWSLPALCAEFGAAAVYSVARRGTVRVEGWAAGIAACCSAILSPPAIHGISEFHAGQFSACQIKPEQNERAKVPVRISSVRRNLQKVPLRCIPRRGTARTYAGAPPSCMLLQRRAHETRQ